MRILDCVPVFLYHHVNHNIDDLYTVTPDIFNEQMHYLYKNGFETVTCDDLMDFMKNGRKLRKSVMLTFDDGWLDNYVFVVPILKKYGLKATFFIVPKWIENASKFSAKTPAAFPRHQDAKACIDCGNEYKVVLNWRQVEEMNNCGLAEFYSHTYSHVKCSQLDRKQLITEISKAKRSIEKKLKKECAYLCWPHGCYNLESIQVAQQCGYRGLFTTHIGAVATGANPLLIKRVEVLNDAGWFERNVQYHTNLLYSRVCVDYNRVVNRVRDVFGINQ